MSRPARSWSLMTVSSASVNCSRNATSFIPLESGLPASPSVYQDGRGHDPVTVVGSIRSRVAVRTGRVRIVHAPWFFALPGLRRFHGYELGLLILVRAPLDEVTEDLVTHE